MSAARIPLQWRVDDRCAVDGEIGRVDAISGDACTVELEDGRLVHARLDELDLVPFVDVEHCRATGKRRHATRAAADRNQRKVDRHRQCQVYRCGACHGWHLGNPHGVRRSK